MLSAFSDKSIPHEDDADKRAKEAVEKAIKMDPFLSPFRSHLEARQKWFHETLAKLENISGNFKEFTNGHLFLGFNIENEDLIYREWAPAIEEAFLIGDFNNWDRTSHRMIQEKDGIWKISLPKNSIPEKSRVKTSFRVGNRWFDRISPWISRAEYNPCTNFYEAVYIPKKAFHWNNPKPEKPKSLLIYEGHIGIATAQGKVGSYREFTLNIIPRVKQMGYNCIQLMAIMEHAYYASFGYQVTSFFAPSSRYGTIDDLKNLIDAAHGHGILVFLDIVHSHACKNTLDGLNQFDGTEGCFFHEGSRGNHDLWDSRLFNYGKPEVLRFLLSNLRWWIEEFHFDGFRFDGITSMLYYHHGISYGFSGDYREYFGPTVDWEAVVYLQLANKLIHQFGGISIAEDVSGMPLLGRPIEEAGLGFDYRLNMAVPDLWIKMLKEQRDEEWSMGHLVHTLTNRRWQEKTIAYAESHDQALVGDKTIAFWLMDSVMYTHMSLSVYPAADVVIDRGIALHKMIRLITFALGGESWLCFMGNEFGHPEWLDFPREGNKYR
jgi:1,4-alpha-glucan branching enzyme